MGQFIKSEYRQLSILNLLRLKLYCDYVRKYLILRNIEVFEEIYALLRLSRDSEKK